MRSLFLILSLLSANMSIASTEINQPEKYSINFTKVSSSDYMRSNALVLDLFLSLGLQKGKDATTAVSHLLQDVVLTENEFHKRGQKLIDAIGTIRALLFIDAEGTLRFDTHTYPAKKYNLSKRAYFIEALKAPRGAVIVSAPVKGKSSGTTFVPIAKAVYKNRELLGVVVAVISPRKLINLDVTNDCVSCLSVLTTLDGVPIAQEPAELFDEGIQDLIKSLNHSPATGSAVRKIRDKSVKVSWRRSDTAPIISFHLKFNRN